MMAGPGRRISVQKLQLCAVPPPAPHLRIWLLAAGGLQCNWGSVCASLARGATILFEDGGVSAPFRLRALQWEGTGRPPSSREEALESGARRPGWLSGLSKAARWREACRIPRDGGGALLRAPAGSPSLMMGKELRLELDHLRLQPAPSTDWMAAASTFAFKGAAPSWESCWSPASSFYPLRRRRRRAREKEGGGSHDRAQPPWLPETPPPPDPRPERRRSLELWGRRQSRTRRPWPH